MGFWSEVITDKIGESRDFYVRLFGCEVMFEADWFVLLRRGETQLGFLKPGLETQAPIFRGAYAGRGTWIAVDTGAVDDDYRRFKQLGVPIELELRDEPWGDRHFVVLDPSGVPVDVVQYRPPG